MHKCILEDDKNGAIQHIVTRQKEEKEGDGDIVRQKRDSDTCVEPAGN